MNVLTYFDHPLKKQNIEYFSQLIRVAKSDNTVCSSELEFLHRMGRKLGLTAPEIDKLIDSTVQSDYMPPYELSKRFDQVYEIVKLSLTDGVIDNNEMRLAKSFAVISGFNDNEIPDLLTLLIRGIKEGKDEEELFDVYKKEIKTRLQ